MKLYTLSFAGGLLAGVLYAIMGIRSPAPPVVALLGLLGMLVGEQSVPLVRRFLSERAERAGPPQGFSSRRARDQQASLSPPGLRRRPAPPAEPEDPYA